MYSSLFFFSDELGVTAGTGKIQNVDKFDSMFFNAHPKLAEVMDVLTKLSLERSVEAIIDAGLSPADLYGTNTAVFMGSAISETEMMVMDCSKLVGFSMLGRSRTMQANRVSYILNLTGMERYVRYIFFSHYIFFRTIRKSHSGIVQRVSHECLPIHNISLVLKKIYPEFIQVKHNTGKVVLLFFF